ncbi:autotransporter outer membrane beta-barrel domain-containing protein [Parendozoicomonas sp. Alg238-R29]|uniref:autotransporter outer membrane beta-barrel domain-containing protein n=1 Tax=Parendozoicomonas sp. Alg238-R29 TaxID=2993446 RepID=UPI00248E5DFA|nr:autotransporter outer membrane beta-barrel domain-containing protein [Parendozoicomonas sp. Alg238-R29]
MTVFELGAGVRLSHLVETDRGPLLPELSLFAFHDFKADKVTQDVSAEVFNLPLSFRTVGIEPEKTRYQAGLGLAYWMDNNLSLSFNYDHIWQSGFKADSVQAKVRYDF